MVRPLHWLEESRLPVSVKKDGWNGFWFWSVNVGGRLLYGDRRICENKVVKIVLVGTYRGRPLYGAGRAGSAGVSARARL